jgi:hypothetical protein
MCSKSLNICFRDKNISRFNTATITAAGFTGKSESVCIEAAHDTPKIKNRPFPKE